jgi:hypothetical protein
MIRRLLSWLNGSPMEEPKKDMGVEHRLAEKKERIDESIERGRVSADRLRKISNHQVAEAHVAIATIRGLLNLLQNREDSE